MKKMMIMLAMAMMCSVAIAQTETTKKIHGAVVDKNGNPLPGAIVSATEGAETTLVNADGTFELEIPIWLKSVTASYAGYRNKKMKTMFDSDMIFHLKKAKKHHGFLNVFGGAVIFDDYGYALVEPTFGLMGGMLGNVGFYIKAGISGVIDYSGGVVIAGVTKRLYKNIYAYLGAGFGSVLNEYEYSGYPGMAFDGGLIFGIGRHFDLTVGYTHTTDFYDYNMIPNISLGYVF